MKMKGLYSATEAKQKLGGISGESLRRLVDDGKIRKFIPAGNRKRGMYVKEDVDKLAKAQEEFREKYLIAPQTEGAGFTELSSHSRSTT